MIVWLVAAGLAHPGAHERLAALEGRQQSACDAESLVQIGRARFLSGDVDGALEDFTAARRCDSHATDVNREEARVRSSRFESVRATDLLLAHLEVEPLDGQALVLLAGTYAQRARWDDAALCWKLALERSEAWEPDHILSWAEAVEWSRGPEAALRLIERALERGGVAPAVDDRALELEISLGRFDSALRRLDARMKARPRSLDSWLLEGDVLAAAGRDAEAEASWKEVAARFDALPPRLKNSRSRALRDQATERLTRR